MYDFTGRRALVTGGSRGIGAAVVRQLLDGGADVLAVARTTAYAPPQGARFATTDLRTTEGVRALADTADRELGGVDVIVHAAGGAQANDSGSTLGLTDGDWQDALDLNLLAAVRLDALLAPGMRDRGVGAIVHVSTAALVPPVPPFAHYQAAKAGLESYSRSLAAELAPAGVRVNAVGPGRTATPGGEATRQRWAGTADATGSADVPPLGRDGRPDDVAGAVVYLASDLASWVTGAYLSVDGGEYPRG